MPFASDVIMPDGSTYTVKALLGKAESNAKLNKSEKSGKGIMTVGLSLAPSNSAGVGNMCPSSSHGCVTDCIFTSGQAAIFRTIPAARIAKTRLFKLHKPVFIDRLLTEIRHAEKRAIRADMKLAIRLNVFSDVQWDKEIPGLYRMFPDVIFYDYTKIYNRMMRYLSGDFPRNYHLTFSRSETNHHLSVDVLNKGGNIAVPFAVTYHGDNRKPLPRKFHGYNIVDGDITDLRFLDKKARKGKTGYVVGLRAKGKARKDVTSGFVVQSTDAAVSW